MQEIYHFVGSTLPISYILKNLDSSKLNIFYTHNELIYNSYNHLKKINSSLTVKKIGGKKYLYLFNLLRILLKIKLSNGVIRIYHELGLHFLDIVILLIKPNGEFHPQSPLGGGWNEINYNKMPNSLFLNFLIASKLIKNFQCFEYKDTNGKLTDIGYKIKVYPPSIVINEPSYFINYGGLNSDHQQKNILFIVGMSYINDVLMKKIFIELLTLCVKNGFNCSIKDHPNPNYRLNLDFSGAILIDPSIPSELIVDNYEFVVGSSSTSLLSSKQSISIIYIINGYETIRADEYRNLFENIAPNRTKYIKSIEEFEDILNYSHN